MNENILNESIIRNDLSKCMVENDDHEMLIEDLYEEFSENMGDKNKICSLVKNSDKSDIEEVKGILKGHIDELRSENEHDSANDFQKLYDDICSCQEMKEPIKSAVDYLKSKNFEVFENNGFIEFKGETVNADGQKIESEGSIEISDGDASYSVAMTVDGEEMDADTGYATFNNIPELIDSIIAPTFSYLNESEDIIKHVKFDVVWEDDESDEGHREEFEADVNFGNDIDMNDEDEVVDYLLDYLSDEYGYLVKEFSYEIVEPHEFDFNNADFSWNSEADSFENLDFCACDGIEDVEVEDFDNFLKTNFPKEYETLRTLSNAEMWGAGFESYVIRTMQKEGENNAGCYVDPDSPLILFRKATKF